MQTMKQAADFAKQSVVYYTLCRRYRENTVDMGEDALKKVLIGCEKPELYSSHGTYQEGGHNRCVRLNGNRFTKKVVLQMPVLQK